MTASKTITTTDSGLEDGTQAPCEEPIQRVFRKLYVVPVVGTTLFLSSVAHCVLFWRSPFPPSDNSPSPSAVPRGGCFGFSWLGFFAALTGQTGFACAWILIALFVRTFRGASTFKWFAGLLVLIFYEVVSAGVFVSILKALQSLTEDDGQTASVSFPDDDDDALDRGVLSWVVLTSWCTFVLVGFYRCVFPSRVAK